MAPVWLAQPQGQSHALAAGPSGVYWAQELDELTLAIDGRPVLPTTASMPEPPKL
jgi:hypothetical protein